MRLLMLEHEIDRLAVLFNAVVGQLPPVEAKERERDPVKIRNGVATIRIVGPLYPKRNSWMDYWGEDYAVYSEIISDVAVAKSKGAKKIDFEIDSPGGYIDGLYDAMKAIANAGIPTRTIAGDVLASAAYMLASQTDQIVCESEVAAVGSVGIATTIYVSNWFVDIANSDSQKKRPDVTTKEGKKVVEDELDDFYEVYAEMIASGRGVSVEKVKKNYGQGAVMTARTALSKGMIDGIMQSNQPAKPAASIGAERMNLEELKANDPGLYEKVIAIGKEAGSKEERDRVCAHLKLAEGSGDIETAHKAIEDGDGITAVVQAAHLSAAMKRQQRTDRAADEPPPVDASDETTITEASREAQAKKNFEAENKGWVIE